MTMSTGLLADEAVVRAVSDQLRRKSLLDEPVGFRDWAAVSFGLRVHKRLPEVSGCDGVSGVR